jgi:hypothetical protein
MTVSISSNSSKEPIRNVPNTQDEIPHKSPQDNAAIESGVDVRAADQEYITGFKLLAVVGSVTLVVFLLLVDTSILGTVSM